MQTILFSDDAKSLVTIAADGRIILWDVESGEARKIVNTNKIILSVNPIGDSGHFLVSCHESASVIYDSSTLDLISNVPAYGFYQSLSADGSIGVGTAMDLGTCIVWKVNPPKQLYKVNGHPTAGVKAAMQPQGKLFATAGQDGIVKIWKTQTGEELLAFQEHAAGDFISKVERVTFSPDGKTVYSGDDHGRLICWNAQDGKVHWRYPEDSIGSGFIIFLKVSPDGKMVA